MLQARQQTETLKYSSENLTRMSNRPTGRATPFRASKLTPSKYNTRAARTQPAVYISRWLSRFPRPERIAHARLHVYQ